MANKKNEEAIANQIGGLGGEAPAAEEQGLGKLKHKSSYGGMKDLTPDEEKDMAAFLQRSERAAAARRERTFDPDPEPREEVITTRREVRVGTDETPAVAIADGWIPVDRREMGIRSQFYPENWEFYIRPATVQAIKNWIGIDEKNALQMNNTFDEIIKLCVRIKVGDSSMSWSHINTWDRLWFILKVREYTFASNKKTVTFEDSCEECGEEITFELLAKNLHYEFPDPDIVEKHWDPETLEWHIDPAEYGVNGEREITLWVPTLAKQQAIIDWAQRQYQRKKKLDETFVSTFLPWMIEKASRDEVQFDRQVQKIERAYKDWGVPMYSLMNDIIRNITINPKETLKQVCPHCGEEVVSNVQFPNGIKVLFSTETGVQKFGSR
jgi:rRNA maturation protein Nop10